MKLVFLILAHKNMQQLDQLVNVLHHENAKIIIHLDNSAEAESISTFKFSNHPSVHLIYNTEASTINWGGFSIVNATIKMLDYAIDKESEDYYILLSGQDFPLQPFEFVYQFFASNHGKLFLEYNALPYTNWEDGGLDRLRHYWLGDLLPYDISMQFYRFQKSNKIERPFFEDFSPFGGSQWWCLTTSCIIYILDFINYNPELVSFYRYSYIPDETFFHTIIMNSDFGKNVDNNNLRFIEFNKSGHPRILGIEDYDNLKASNNFWARKFDYHIDNEIIKKLSSDVL